VEERLSRATRFRIGIEPIFQGFSRGFRTLLPCLPEPPDGLLRIPGNPLAPAIHVAEIVLRRGVPLLCRPAIPRDGPQGIFCHPLAVGIRPAKVALRGGVPLIRRFPIPPDGLLAAPRYRKIGVVFVWGLRFIY